MSTVFRKWVHEDNETTEVKLRLVRELSSEDKDEEEMLTTARAHVGAVLVAYAQGNPKVENVKPYGLKASKSRKAFKDLPTTTLALTFAVLYQVVRTDPDILDKWIKTPRQSITQPWPRGMIKRFVKLQEVFENYRWFVFDAYEASGGEYFGMETPKNTTTTSVVEDPLFVEDFD